MKISLTIGGWKGPLRSGLGGHSGAGADGNEQTGHSGPGAAEAGPPRSQSALHHTPLIYFPPTLHAC